MFFWGSSRVKKLTELLFPKGVVSFQILLFNSDCNISQCSIISVSWIFKLNEIAGHMAMFMGVLYGTFNFGHMTAHYNLLISVLYIPYQ